MKTAWKAYSTTTCEYSLRRSLFELTMCRQVRIQYGREWSVDQSEPEETQKDGQAQSKERDQECLKGQR